MTSYITNPKRWGEKKGSSPTSKVTKNNFQQHINIKYNPNDRAV